MSSLAMEVYLQMGLVSSFLFLCAKETIRPVVQQPHEEWFLENEGVLFQHLALALCAI